MPFEGAPDWAGDYLDPAEWQASEPFNPSNDLHIDRLAGALHFAFAAGNDQPAFKRLVEITTPRLQTISEDIAQDEGLVLPAENLLDAFWSRVFVDLTPLKAPIPHFLSHGAERMRLEAEAWVRDLALADPPEQGDAIYFAKIVQIAFHQLPIEQRRLLRGKDVCRMPDADLAKRYDMPADEVPAAVAAARQRLDELTSRLDGADS